MHCENCGNKNNDSQVERSSISLDERWWHRLLKVAYIFVYMQIFWVVPAVWDDNNNYYSGGEWHDSSGVAFFSSILAMVIFMVVLRLIKLSVLYVTFAQKPVWRDEFNKFF